MAASRTVISKELAHLFGVLAHPDRIRLIEELRSGEVDVNGLQAALGIPHARVSQQLAILRAHRIAAERRDGRRVYYRLVNREIAEWLLAGAEFLRADVTAAEQLRSAIDEVNELWGPPRRALEN